HTSHSCPSHASSPLRALHSFPTRRSSDLTFVSAPEFTKATGLQFYQQTLERLRNLTGVRSAALTRFLPLMATGQENDCVSADDRSEEHTSELQSSDHLVCRLLLEKKK